MATITINQGGGQTNKELDIIVLSGHFEACSENVHIIYKRKSLIDRNITGNMIIT